MTLRQIGTDIIALAPFCGGTSHVVFEGADEVGVIVETAGLGGFCDGKAVFQKLFRQCELFGEDILLQGDSRLAHKLRADVIFRIGIGLGKLGNF